MWHEPKAVLGRIWITWNVYIGRKYDWRQMIKDSTLRNFINRQIWSKVSKEKKLKINEKMKDINDKSWEKVAFLKSSIK